MVGHLSPASSTSVPQEHVLRTAVPCNDNHYIFSVFCWCHRSGSRGQCFRPTFDHLQGPINSYFGHIENEKEKTHLCQEMCNNELKGEYLHFIPVLMSSEVAHILLWRLILGSITQGN